MRRLRDPETGCEWDRAQSFASIAPYTIEEAYEVADAIDRADYVALEDELGDLLLQVVFHSQIAADENRFGFADVVAGIRHKMERRHPHIFSDQEVASDWEMMKAVERESGAADRSPGALEGVALALPALKRAEKVQKRAARVGFDWTDRSQVRAKVGEELQEFDDAATDNEREEELGDLLFAAVNLARHDDIDAEAALAKATRKFERRFAHVERLAGGSVEGNSLSKLNAFWNDAKRAEKS